MAERYGNLFGNQYGFISGSNFLNAGEFVAVIGDSHAVGASDSSAADTAFRVTTLNTGVLVNGRYAAGAGVDPPNWTNFDANLVMRYLQAPHLGTMGTEMTLGTTFQSIVTLPAISMTGGNGYLLDQNWKPSSTFMLGTTGTNLFNTWINSMNVFASSVSKKLGAVAVLLGGNDANAGGAPVANYQANLTALIAGIRAAFGSTIPVIVMRTNINTSGPTAPNLAAVRTAQENVVAGDARTALIDTDDLNLLGDSIHYTDNSNLVIGNRIAFAMADLLGYSRVQPTVPSIVGWGPHFTSASTLAPKSWAGDRNGDINCMFVTTTNTVTGQTITTPAGWTAIGTPTETASSGIFTTFNLYARKVTTAMLVANNNHTAPTSITVSGNTNSAKIFTIRGAADLDVTNIEALTLWAENGFATSKTVPAITTLTNGSGVFCLPGGWTGGIGRSQVVTNGTLTNFTQHQNGCDVSNTAAVCMAACSGFKATTGSSGTFGVAVSPALGVLGCAAIFAVKP